MKNGLFITIFVGIPVGMTLFIAGVMGYLGHSYLVKETARRDAEISELKESTQKELSQISTSLSETTNVINAELTRIGEAISLAKDENLGLLEKLSDEQKRVSSFQREVEKVTDSVGTLEKLTKTDPELLQKYSKVFFLNEHYQPPRLAEIQKSYLYSESQLHKIHQSVLPFLTDMLDAAKSDGIELYVKSAFRSFNEQSIIKGSFTVTYGAGTANTFSADQGYSEHQLGTTVDLITPGLGGELTIEFANTSAYTWLKENAYKYGFVLSYPQSNEYYMYEPWHWRFVGTKLAKDVHAKGIDFYEMDQRDIDEYLANIFD